MHIFDKKILSSNLKDARKKLGLTQEAMGKRLNVSRETIRNYENGETMPTPDILICYCQIASEDLEHIVLGENASSDVRLRHFLHKIDSATQKHLLAFLEGTVSCHGGEI